MPRPGFYLYGFSRGGVAPPEGVEAVRGTAAAALVSEVDLDGYDADGPGGPSDPEWLIPRALHHEAMLQAVLRYGPVLPVRFGSVFTSREAVRSLLESQERAIAAFLDGIEGRQEWSLKAAVRPEKAGAWLLDHDPALARRRERLPAAPGARYFQEKQLHLEARRLLVPWGRQIGADLTRELTDWTPDIRHLPLRGPVRDALAGDPLLNCAILLADDRVSAFCGWAEERARELGERGVVLTCTGPFPAYSFCPAADPAESR